jgi:hypothetical protein
VLTGDPAEVRLIGDALQLGASVSDESLLDGQGLIHGGSFLGGQAEDHAVARGDAGRDSRSGMREVAGPAQ